MPDPAKSELVSRTTGHLSDRLTSSLAPGRSRRGTPDDAVDRVLPALVVTPRDADDAIMIVGEAVRAGLAVIPTGGWTKLAMGNAPVRYDIRLSTRAMAAVVEQSKEDMVITVESGITLSALNRHLASHGQRLAIDASDPKRTTVGGIAACNFGGGLARAYGTARDLILGMEWIDGRGRKLKTGGRVVKNVAGYDLVRLFAGSYGTLGLATKVTLRTHPLPEGRRVFRLRFATAQALETFREAAAAAYLPVSALDCTTRPDHDSNWDVIALAEGSKSEIDSIKNQLEGLSGRKADEQPVEDWRSPLHPSPETNMSLRFAILPSEMMAAGERVISFLANSGVEARVSGRLIDGLMKAHIKLGDDKIAPELLQTVREITQQFRAATIVELAPDSVKEAFDAWDRPPRNVALMKKVKLAFDPESLFCPGRFVAGI